MNPGKPCRQPWNRLRHFLPNHSSESDRKLRFRSRFFSFQLISRPPGRSTSFPMLNLMVKEIPQQEQKKRSRLTVAPQARQSIPPLDDACALRVAGDQAGDAAERRAGNAHPGISCGWHRLQPGFPQLEIAWLVDDFAVPSLRPSGLLLAFACEAYKAVRAAFAACLSAFLASDRADLDFLPIVVFLSSNYRMKRARASARTSCAS
jgi:hypothetical protein